VDWGDWQVRWCPCCLMYCRVAHASCPAVLWLRLDRAIVRYSNAFTNDDGYDAGETGSEDEDDDDSDY